MSAAATVSSKFSFELDLGQAHEKSRIISDYELTKLLKDAENNGYQRGLRAGEKTATTIAAKQLVMDTQALLKQAAAIENTTEQKQKLNRADAIKLSITVAKKLSGNMIARRPLGEIEKLIAECVSSLDQVPHLVIRCHPDLAEKVRLEAETQIQSSGFSGRLIIMGEPDIGFGDARLEWVDGGLVRDVSEISAEIDNKITAYLDADPHKNTAAGNVEGSETPGAQSMREEKA